MTATVKSPKGLSNLTAALLLSILADPKLLSELKGELPAKCEDPNCEACNPLNPPVTQKTANAPSTAADKQASVEAQAMQANAEGRGDDALDILFATTHEPANLLGKALERLHAAAQVGSASAAYLEAAIDALNLANSLVTAARKAI